MLPEIAHFSCVGSKIQVFSLDAGFSDASASRLAPQYLSTSLMSRRPDRPKALKLNSKMACRVLGRLVVVVFSVAVELSQSWKCACSESRSLQYVPVVNEHAMQHTSAGGPSDLPHHTVGCRCVIGAHCTRARISASCATSIVCPIIQA